MAVTDRIDLQPEIAQWKDAPYGRDVRAANMAAFEKIETSVNAAIDNVNQASEDAQQAVTSADGAASRAETAETNAKKAAEDAIRAAEEAENVTNVSIMTTEKAGIGKPDGETINANMDGTMRAIILDALGLAGEAGQSVGMQVMIDAVAQKVANELLKRTDVISQIINDATKAASMAALYSVDQKVGDTTKLPDGVVDLATAAAQLYSNYNAISNDLDLATAALNPLKTARVDNIDSNIMGVVNIVAWDSDTASTPKTTGNTIYGNGFCLTYSIGDRWLCQLAMAVGDPNLFTRYRRDGVWSGWTTK